MRASPSEGGDRNAGNGRRKRSDEAPVPVEELDHTDSGCAGADEAGAHPEAAHDQLAPCLGVHFRSGVRTEVWVVHLDHLSVEVEGARLSRRQPWLQL